MKQIRESSVYSPRTSRPRQVKYGNDVVGLQELITYGLKGAAAYAEHAEILGKESDTIYTMVHEVLDFLARENATVEEYLGMAMKVGELNLKISKYRKKKNDLSRFANLNS
jgi:hydroxylamine reductase